MILETSHFFVGQNFRRYNCLAKNFVCLKFCSPKYIYIGGQNGRSFQLVLNILSTENFVHRKILSN